MDLTKDVASVIVDLVTVLAIVFGAIWAVARFGLFSTFRPAAQISITKEEVKKIGGSKVVALRLKIKNVSNVRLELIGASLVVAELRLVPKSGVIPVKDLRQRGMRGDHSVACVERIEMRKKRLEELTRLGSFWPSTESFDDLQKAGGRGAVVSMVLAVNPREEDSILVPCVFSPRSQALDVEFKVYLWAERRFLLFGRRRGTTGHVLFRSRRIVDVRKLS